MKLADYRITVRTSDIDHAGTNAKVHVTLHGTDGTNNGDLILDDGKENFERNTRDDFERQTPDVGELLGTFVWHDNAGGGSGWHCDRIIIWNRTSDVTWTCPCNRWLARGMDDNAISRWLPAEKREPPG